MQRDVLRYEIELAFERADFGLVFQLIDELDRTDEPFEAYLLELLSDFQITIPEIGRKFK